MSFRLHSAIAAVAIWGLLIWPARAADAPPQATASDVPVRMVVLFSSGVGYFEHAGTVSGDATAELRFKTQQINDILKSLVVQDTGGTVSTVVYPSQDPIAKTLRSFQVDITGNPSLAELLNQLRGARISVSAGGESVAGTILGAEKRPKAVEKGQIEIWVLNVLTGATIRSVELDTVSSLELQDPQLQQELTKALAALAQARDQDTKPVRIRFQGTGSRTVRLGYVVETPVWKTSYRLILDEKPMLQGWAIVENQTDNDWNQVQLALVSGRPISFIQELYQPLYLPRPVVQPELFASLRPQNYAAGIDAQRERQAAAPAPAPAAPRAARGGAAMAARALADRAEVDMAAPAEMQMMKASVLDASASVQALASAEAVGELFQYAVGNVSLPRQRSAMIPIISSPIDLEKVSIYNQNVLPRNPLNGAILKNSTKNHLLAGPLTVLEGGSYAGDARLDNVPPGQQRLLSYGVDLQMLVNAAQNRQENTIQSGRIIKGVLHLQRKHVFTQEYEVQNRDEKPRTLIIEHPIRRGWTLMEPKEPMEKTDTLYRFRMEVPAGRPTSLTVREQNIVGETIAILPADLGTLELYSKTGEIAPKVRDALARAAAMKMRMEETNRQIEQHRRQLTEITQEQGRIRENLRVTTAARDYQAMLLKKLSDQEGEIEKIQATIRELQQTSERQRRELEDYLAELDIE